MVSVTVLGSGSRGNAILIDGSEGTVMIDAGFGTRSLSQRLALAERRPEEVQALLLTHEHTDHASGATAAQQRWQWPLYSLDATLVSLEAQPRGRPTRTTAMDFAAPTLVAGFSVTCIPVPHDAQACSAFVLTDLHSGARIGVALDVGHVTEALVTGLTRCDILVVESNHDERMLATGPYPRHLKHRVGGSLGHLSNGDAAAFATQLSHRGLRGVILAHLSETNNTPTLAIECTRDALRHAGWMRDTIWAASQSVPCSPIGANGITHRVRTSQLTLGF